MNFKRYVRAQFSVVQDTATAAARCIARAAQDDPDAVGHLEDLSKSNDLPVAATASLALRMALVHRAAVHPALAERGHDVPLPVGDGAHHDEVPE